MPRKEQATEVAVKNIQTAISTAPTFIQEAGTEGTNDMDSNDLIVPRLNLLQELSPECLKGNEKHIAGAESGKIINTLTKELFDEIKIINLYHVKEYPVFKNRKFGKGFYGTFPSEQTAAEFIDSHAESNQLTIAETVSVYVLTLNPDNTPMGEAIIPMTSTKIGFVKRWNSRIFSSDAPRFSAIWTLGTVVQKNGRGDQYYNYEIKGDPVWINDENMFKAAQEKYKLLKDQFSGRASEEEAA